MSTEVSRFWREIPQRYNLVGTKCENCNTVYFPQIDICPRCRRSGFGKLEPKKLRGTGEVVSYTIVHVAPEGFEEQVPYIIAIIELDEGPRLTAQIVDCEPEDIDIGTKVEASFRKIQEEGQGGAIHYGYKFKKSK